MCHCIEKKDDNKLKEAGVGPYLNFFGLNRSRRRRIYLKNVIEGVDFHETRIEWWILHSKWISPSIQAPFNVGGWGGPIQ